MAAHAAGYATELAAKFELRDKVRMKNERDSVKETTLDNAGAAYPYLLLCDYHRT